MVLFSKVIKLLKEMGKVDNKLIINDRLNHGSDDKVQKL